MIYDVGIVTLAHKLPTDLVNRFSKFMAEARPQCSCVIYVVDEWNCNSVTNGEFNRCIADNAGILALKDNCRVIVCSDIDMLIPPGFIDITYRQALKSPTHSFARHIAPENISPREWTKWAKDITYRGGSYGGWNAMTVDDWFKCGGWNEDLYGWGSEDVELHDRLISKDMKATSFTQYPVMHVTHPPRGTTHRNKLNRNIWVDNTERLSINWLENHTGTIERPQHKLIPIKTGKNSTAVVKKTKSRIFEFPKVKRTVRKEIIKLPEKDYVDPVLLNANMNATTPFASLVLVCYRRYDSLIDCLNQYLDFDIPLNVLLWVNAFHEIPLVKRQKIQQLLTKFNGHKLVLSRQNVGTAKSRNELITYARNNFKTKYIAISDDDVQFKDKTSFCVPATLLDQAEYHEYGAMGIHYKPWSPIATVDSDNNLKAVKPTEFFHDTDVLSAATMVFRGELVDKGINVDPQYKIGWVDWDFTYSMRQAGYKLGLLCDPRYYATNTATGDAVYKKNRYNRQLSEKNIELFRKKFGVTIIPGSS